LDYEYDEAANGERFLVNEPIEDAAIETDRPTQSLRVVFNWNGLLVDP
jgi:hypothetical protein